MFISGAKIRLCLLLFVTSLFYSGYSEACSCSWKGPFMEVARDAPIVVRGAVIRHNTGPKPSIDFHVKEVLSGAMLDSGMRILTGDGMYCRPEAGLFPVATEWILAVNGPGSKPGNDLAISNCGEYWLKVEGDKASGSIFGKDGETRKISLDAIRDFFRYPPFEQQLRGKVEKGAEFITPFGIRFEFLLEPVRSGWEIFVREKGRAENLARLTPHLHSSPNPRSIEACHFEKPSDNCPCSFGPGSSLSYPRRFIFSPLIGKEIDGSDSKISVTPEEIEKVALFGSGEFYVEKYGMGKDEKGCPVIKVLEFRIMVKGGYNPQILRGEKDADKP